MGVYKEKVVQLNRNTIYYRRYLKYYLHCKKKRFCRF